MAENYADERTMVADVLARRRGSFERLVARHEALVWHVVGRLVACPEDTRDLSQEVFIRVYKRLAQFRFESSLSTWIGRIAYTIAVRHLQRREVSLVDADVGNEMDVEARGPEAETRARQASAVVARELDRLAPLPRLIVSLYHLEEMTVAEVCAVVGMPAGTVKSHLFRARESMKASLHRQGIAL